MQHDDRALFDLDTPFRQVPALGSLLQSLTQRALAFERLANIYRQARRPGDFARRLRGAGARIPAGALRARRASAGADSAHGSGSRRRESSVRRPRRAVPDLAAAAVSQRLALHRQRAAGAHPGDSRSAAARRRVRRPARGEEECEGAARCAPSRARAAVCSCCFQPARSRICISRQVVFAIRPGSRLRPACCDAANARSFPCTSAAATARSSRRWACCIQACAP